METIALVVHLLLALALIGVVLMQRSEGGALGIGGGGGGLFSARGTANALTRATAILGALFLASSLFLSILAGQDSTGRSIFDVPEVAQDLPATNIDGSSVDSTPTVPLAE